MRSHHLLLLLLPSDSPGLCLPTDSVVWLFSDSCFSPGLRSVRELERGVVWARLVTSKPASISLASVEADKEEKLSLSRYFGLNSDIGRTPAVLWTWPK